MATTAKMSARTKAERKETAKRIGAEVVAGLEQVLATLEVGGQKAVDEKYGIPLPPVDEKYGIRPPPAVVVLKVPLAGKKEVKAARQALGVSQAMFALILGASEQAVRAWEQGTKPPPGVARRLIGEIHHDPAYWRKRFGLAEAAKG